MAGRLHLNHSGLKHILSENFTLELAGRMRDKVRAPYCLEFIQVGVILAVPVLGGSNCASDRARTGVGALFVGGA